MAKELELTWNKKQRRWFKKYNLKQYSISQKQVGLPDDEWTKSKSYPAALDYWKKKQSEIDAGPVSVVPTLTRLITGEIVSIEDARLMTDAMSRIVDLSATDAAGQVYLLNAIKRNRASLKRPEEIDDNKLLSHWIEAYRKQAQKDEADGIIKAGRYGKLDNSLNWILKFFNQQSIDSVDSIDTFCLESIHGWLTAKYKKEKVLSAYTCRDHWQVFHVWVQWLAQHHVIPMPLNINSKKFRFKLKKVKYRYWTKKEFQTVYNTNNDRLRLYLLLVANCGFYASDIADIKKSELDLKAGTITRQRNKTGEDIDEEQYEHSSNVPVVKYFLWPETLKLLKQLLSSDLVLALTNEDGGPLWRSGVYPEGHKKAGKHWKINNIISIYRRWYTENKIENPPTFEMLRKSSAQSLSDSPHKDCADLFGGWAESTTRTKHYTEITDEKFREALAWLRTQYL